MHLTGVLPYEFDMECSREAGSIVIFNRLHGRDYALRRGPEEEPLDIPPHVGYGIQFTAMAKPIFNLAKEGGRRPPTAAGMVPAECELVTIFDPREL